MRNRPESSDHRSSWINDQLQISCFQYKTLLLPVSRYHYAGAVWQLSPIHKKRPHDNGLYDRVPATSGASSRVQYDKDYWRVLFPRFSLRYVPHVSPGNSCNFLYIDKVADCLFQ